MVTIHPQFIKDASGNTSMVVLPVHEYQSMLEALEDLDDCLLFDDAKNEDSGERISLAEYVKNRKSING